MYTKCLLYRVTNNISFSWCILGADPPLGLCFPGQIQGRFLYIYPETPGKKLQICEVEVYAKQGENRNRKCLPSTTLDDLLLTFAKAVYSRACVQDDICAG